VKKKVRGALPAVSLRLRSRERMEEFHMGSAIEQQKAAEGKFREGSSREKIFK
jgi:hypothetical protein